MSDSKMTVDEALEQPGLLIAAWDDAHADEEWLGIYRAGDGGVKLLAYERMPASARVERSGEIGTRAALGATSGGEFVWCAIGDELVVWNLSERVCAINTSQTEAVRCVTSFVDDNDLGHRGVCLERANGDLRVLVEEHDPTPEMDPTYDRSNVSIDGAWASALGKDIARFLGVPHVDQI